MLLIKESVRPLIWHVLPIVIGTFEKAGYDTIITSANDSSHMKASLHYKGKALDFRIKHVKLIKDRQAIFQELRTTLKKYDVLWEGKGTPNEHLHIEEKGK